ncbi:MAG: tetratricopeptide repeat protein, partial [Bacteroidota bacterium]
MKYTLFFTIVILFLSTSLYGQNSKLDSLLAVLKTYEQDTNRVNTLLALSVEYASTTPDERLEYGQEALELAKKLSFKSGIAYAQKNIGIYYFLRTDYENTLTYWESSLKTFEEMKDQEGVSNILSNIGAVYFNQGDDPRALDYYLQSLRVSEQINNKLRIATALTNIGAVYFNNPVNHRQALEYYLRAIKVSEEINYEAALGTSYVNLGEIYMEEDQLDSALYFFNKSAEYLKASGLETYSYAINNIGKLKAIQKKYDESLEYHTVAFEAAKENEAAREMFESMIGQGNAHLGLWMEGKNLSDLEKSYSYFTEALEGAEEEDLVPLIEEARKGLYEYFKEKGNYSQALKYYELYTEVKDSLRNEDTVKKLALLDAEHEFETEKQQLEFSLLSADRRRRSLILGGVIALITLLIFIAILIQYYRLRRIRAAEKYESQRKLAMQEKLATLGQITAGIAHEIKNPLNFVVNFAHGSMEFGKELIEVLEENEEKIPEEAMEDLKDLGVELNENSKIIWENGLRADRVVKRMMEQARGENGEFKETDLNVLIDENFRLAYHGYKMNQAEFDLNIIKEFDENLPKIPLIQQDIDRVILNICNNAF